jgi:hypothetical protein
MKHALILLASLLVPALAFAQAPASYTLKIYNQGASSPVQSTTAPASAATCNLAASPASAGAVPNPKIAEWNDPANAGKVCRIDFSAFFGGLPMNVLQTATLTVTDDLGQVGPESAPSNPFVMAPPPGLLLNLRVIGGK